MSVLTSGRTNPCKDNIGGIRELWLSTFTAYPQNLIVGYRDMLITSYPTTLFYKFEGRDKTFLENLRDDMGYDQEIGITLAKQDLSTSGLLSLLVNGKAIAVVVYNTGKIKVAGIHNGLDAEVSARSGGSKVDFNGYELKLTGNEPFKAPFINAFPGAGFEKDGVDLGCLLASSDRPSSLSDKVASCNIVQ